MRLFNSLTRKIEVFEPINPPQVGMYTCGPTVYSFVTIGNWRTYFLGDIIIRTLNYLGFNVDYIMNITDVGHLTGDNLGDADTGDDRLEKAAQREQKSAWDIAQFYTDDFLKHYDELNLIKPRVFAKATDHIKEQIEMVKTIEEKGFTYSTSDGVYFDTKAYEAAGNIYGQLSNIDQVKEGARVEPNPEKKDPRDFALWKFSYSRGREFDPNADNKGTRRAMEWESPWGLGFPGWHIECSAMSTKYLGCQFDLHLGGEDLRSTHHPNEIAQSESACGVKPFVKYWVHGAFLQVDGGRMGKSLGNAYTLDDITKRGYKPEHLRYFYLTGHYRQPLNFTWDILESKKHAYDKIVKSLVGLKTQVPNSWKVIETVDLSDKAHDFNRKFRQTLENDLQMPEVLAVISDLIKTPDLSPAEKLHLILNWDKVLGLNFQGSIEGKKLKKIYKDEDNNIRISSDVDLDSKIISLLTQREQAKRKKDWQTADNIRTNLKEEGYSIEDTDTGPSIKKL